MHVQIGRQPIVEGQDIVDLKRNFAENLNIAFLTPEEFFLKQEPRPFTRVFDPKSYLGPAAASSIISGEKMYSHELVSRSFP